ncbi:unnamed protein product [Calypogeia fissa]
MDVERLMRGRAIKTTFALGVFFTLSLLWLDNLSTRPPTSSSSFLRDPVCKTHMSSTSDQVSSTNWKRSELYQKMATDLDNNGAAFLDGGETSQSLKFSDLFTRIDNKITPVLKPASPAVRANVLHLQYEYASKIAKIVEKVLSPHLSEGVWYQDPQVYHFSLFHASHHLEPVPASETEVQLESAAVSKVAKSSCPLEIILDRVVLTSTGVLLGCWQVLNGTDPATIRQELRTVLPRAPEKQLYATEILHTSIARLIGPLDSSNKVIRSKEEAVSLLKELVRQLNEELCNFQATVRELWFVEELDVLALALRGRMKVKRLPLQCSSPD